MVDAKKPRAPWRSLEELDKLQRQGKCIRCASSRHKVNKCEKYGPARRQNRIESTLSRDPDGLDSSVSGNYEP